MPQPNANLAESLEVLASLQSTGRRVFASSELSRTHRDRLKAAGFVRPVIKGWWMATDPAALPGDTTAWHACFWEFCGRYCEARFGGDWHLSPELSILLHAEATDVPRQVIVHTPGGSNNTIDLPFGTSVFDYGVDSLPADAQRDEQDGVRLLTLPASLVRAQPSFFEQRPVEAQVALSRIRDASDLLAVLLEGDHVVAAGRLAGALRRLGRMDMADEIAGTMSRAGYRVRENDPFQPDRPLPEIGPRTPAIVARLQGLWQAMRGPVEETFPETPPRPVNPTAYLERVAALYDQDAYHSLSIEGYRVTPELVERVRAGAWDPRENPTDRESRDALAARGYWLAFQGVRDTIERVLADPESAPGLVREQHRAWYRDLFQPAVAAGLLEPSQLAGYRTNPVYIQNSRHVPPRAESVRDAMPALFDLLEGENHQGVRAVLGHWMFGYIHPFPDGNGRVARFLMNAMLASGGYPWTVIRVEDRDEYMAALETASVEQRIEAFAGWWRTRSNGLVREDR
ncbi:MAG: Fic family protein [Longimicrobiales bacterium]